MTYYAVTNDPNELMHFGIKGMKWGIIRTPEQLGHHKPPKSTKPRSPAYLKASAKLSRAMQHGIAKAQANWDAYNSPAAKAARTRQRNEKAFQKHLELARQGRLKYKGISDDEVTRITDRLNLERQSRALSGTEKQSFGRRMREAVGEGIIRGVGQGTAGYIGERMTGRGRTTAEIKGARRKVRAQWTPAGLATRGLQGISNRASEFHENQREDRKYKHELERLDEKREREREQEYKDLAAVYGKEFSFTQTKLGLHKGRAWNYDPNAKMTSAQRAKAIAQMKDKQAEHDYELKRLNDTASDEALVKAVLAQKQNDAVSVYKDELAIYNEGLKEYAKDLKDWNSLSDAEKSVRPKPQRNDYVGSRPTYTPMDINDYWTNYDKWLEDRRRKRSGKS